MTVHFRLQNLFTAFVMQESTLRNWDPIYFRDMNRINVTAKGVDLHKDGWVCFVLPEAYVLGFLE